MLRSVQLIALAANVATAWSPAAWKPQDYYNNNDWDTAFKITLPHIAPASNQGHSPAAPTNFVTKFHHNNPSLQGLSTELARPTGVPPPFGAATNTWAPGPSDAAVVTSEVTSVETIYQTIEITFTALSDCPDEVTPYSTSGIAFLSSPTLPVPASWSTARSNTWGSPPPSYAQQRSSSPVGYSPPNVAPTAPALGSGSPVVAPPVASVWSSTPSAVYSNPNPASAPVESYTPPARKPSRPPPSIVYTQPPAPSPSGCELPSSPLSNELQVGDSVWGSFCQPTFPHWLDNSDGTPYDVAPWGDKTPQNADATIDSDIPRTGVVRYYDFTISRGEIWADGVKRPVMLVNNQFPGPAIEANWGDEIQVTVHNNITAPVEGTAIHYHGFLQRGSNWMDGVPSVSQCPIAPGASFTHRFTAQLYGTSWYHAHYSAQYTAGVVGPIVVYGPSQLPYDIDLGPVMLTDWYHIPYFSVVQDVVGTDLSKIPPTSDGLLINGRGRFDCSEPSYSNSSDWLGSNIADGQSWECIEGAALSRFRFQSGKTHRLRLMNHGADGVQKFSIDGHTMTVIATDFVPTKPYTTDVVTLGVGQRTDVLVTASNSPGSAFWMRVRTPGGPTTGGSGHEEVVAAIYYDGADTSIEPKSESWVYDVDCNNQALDITQPEFPITPSPFPFQQDLTLDLKLNSTGNYEWLINGQTFRANFNYPSLYLAAEGNTSYPYDPQWNVYNFGQNSSVVLNVTNNTPFTHPFHLHGHNFYVLDVGFRGTVWDGRVINPQNPMRRDTQIIPASGWAVLAFEADNPGVWPFHCHVAWHLSGGLAMNVITQPQAIPTIPQGMQDQTCVAWDAYSNSNIVDQIDAGS